MADDVTVPERNYVDMPPGLFKCEGSDTYDLTVPERARGVSVETHEQQAVRLAAELAAKGQEIAELEAAQRSPLNRAQRRAAARGQVASPNRSGITPLRNSLRDLPKRMQGVGAAWRQR